MPSVSLKYVLIFLTLVSTRNSFIEILILSPQTKAHKETGWSGSSPPTWGIPSRRGCSPIRRRFIPTYVGHTGRQSSSPPDNTVHPHIRGAYSFRSTGLRPRPLHPHIRGAYVHTLDLLSSVTGSSPHTWGIHEAQQLKAQRDRFIPTYVGHTRSPAVEGPAGPVHPHIRGAYLSVRADRPGKAGSSPHTWGIRR